ncbi:S8 family serine peptidase [uncultured Acetobacterium sp.]|uniref:S8 family serine peptidase n=1 Tax=uncultured Acetobacterium sp. TaxID=217139 RepID=UPI0025FF4E28|nr:S8 family serine peptidase [uncultured Acetobacterium sp.]
MKFKKSIILLIVLLIFSGLPIGAVAANQDILSYHQVKDLDHDAKIDDQIVIIYQNQGGIKDLGLTTNQIEAGEKLSDQVDIIKVKDGSQVDGLVVELLKNPHVLAAQKNTYLKFASLPNDPMLAQAWQFEAIGADKTWDQVNNQESVVVAVLDTGLNSKHPDIMGKSVDGYDYVTGQTETIDVVGHGTAISGCIAAIANNEIGIAGVAGNADIKIAPYRVGGETVEDNEANLGYACAALYHAANRPEVRVINMSFAGYEVSTVLETAIAYAASMGKILVAASGNDGADPENAGKITIPSAYDNVISVGATDRDNVIGDFSQYNEMVDLCAPGVETTTLWAQDDYITESGTSLSCPVVAGAGAVLVAADATLSAAEVETILKETAIDLGEPGRDDHYGYGLIQLDQALAQVRQKEPLTLSYRTHVQNNGWQAIVNNGEVSGTVGESLRLEAIELNANGSDYDIGVRYQTHVENQGWQDFVENGGLSGTTGESLRLEAIKIELTGTEAEIFDVYYQVHVENIGWLDWAKNGEAAGTEGLGYRMEGITIELVSKGSQAPGKVERPYVKR